MSKLFSTIAVAALFAGLLAGCGGDLEETYMMVSLREAGHGQVPSPGFKFSFDTPNFIAANGDLALVREGNLIEFFTGQNIEEKIEQVEGRKFVVGARKMFSPMVHFTVDFLVAGGDTIRVGEPYGVEFPAIIKGFDQGEYEQIDLSTIGPSTAQLGDIFNTRFIVERATVTYEQVDWPGGYTGMAYLLNLPSVRFFVPDPDPEMELVLRAFMNENLYFDGGVEYGDRPAAGTRNYRERTKIAGPVTFEFIRYGGSVLPVVQE